MNAAWDRVKAIHAEISELEGPERAQRLDVECGDDTALRSEVERLLAQEAVMGSFLERGYQGPAPDESPQEPQFAPGDILASRFQILRFLGAGGMGEVYEARDADLRGKRIALKTIRPEIASDQRIQRRFTEEVLAARAISHPNVCPIYDIFQTATPSGNVRLLTMKLLDGETLASRLSRERIDSSEALKIIRGIASGLTAAHDAGVVHRDLKPGNVMLVPNGNGVRPVITDFGLARELNPDSHLGTRSETHIGGSLDYMAPEQLLGREVTKSADVYSFGVVVFEIASGKRLPLRNLETGAHELPDWSRYAEVPAFMRGVVERCLAAEPQDRYSSVEEAVAALDVAPAGPSRVVKRYTRRVVAAAGLIAVLSTGYVLRDRLMRAWTGLPANRHVVILPFTIGSGNETLAAVAEGTAEAVGARLARHESTESDFWVIPASDAKSNKVADAATAKGAFSATLVLTGRLLRDSTNMRLHLQLSDATSKVLQSRSVVVPNAQMYRLPIRAGETAASMLSLGGLQNEMAAEERPVIPEAFRLVESAKARLRARDVENVKKAVEELQQAVDIDPNYALGYAKLAEAYGTRYYHSKESEFLELAFAASERAAKLNPGLPEVHISAGLLYSMATNGAQALQAFDRVLALDPDNAEALMMKAGTLDRQFRDKEAEGTYKRAIALRPSYWLGYNRIGTFYHRRGRNAEAERMFKYAVQLAPGNTLGYTNLGGLYLVTRRTREAIAPLKKSIEIQPTGQGYANLGTAHFLLKDFPAAANMFQLAVKLQPNDHRLWRNLGDAYKETSGDSASCYSRAIALAEKRLALEPNSTDLLTSLALYHAKLAQNTIARRYLLRIERLPVGVYAKFRQGVALELMGDRANAITSLAAAVSAGYPLQEIEEAFELEDLRRDSRYRTLMGAARSGSAKKSAQE